MKSIGARHSSFPPTKTPTRAPSKTMSTSQVLEHPYFLLATLRVMSAT